MFSSNILHNHKVEATQVFTRRSTGKDSAVYTHGGVSLSLNKKGDSDTCHNTEEP